MKCVKIVSYVVLGACVVIALAGAVHWAKDGAAGAALTLDLVDTLHLANPAVWNVKQIAKDMGWECPRRGKHHGERHLPQGDDMHGPPHGLPHDGMHGGPDPTRLFAHVGTWFGILVIAVSAALFFGLGRKRAGTCKGKRLSVVVHALSGTLLWGMVLKFAFMIAAFAVWAAALGLFIVVLSPKLAPHPEALPAYPEGMCASTCLDLTSFGLRPTWVDTSSVQTCVCDPSTIETLTATASLALGYVASAAGGLVAMFVAGSILVTAAFAHLAALYALHSARSTVEPAHAHEYALLLPDTLDAPPAGKDVEGQAWTVKIGQKISQKA